MGDDECDMEALMTAARRRARRWTRDTARAEELVQEACLSVARAGGEWSLGYLVTAMRSRLVDASRRERIVRFEPIEEASDVQAVAVNALDRLAAESEVGRVLGDLSEEQRTWLRLVSVEGWTMSELAGHTGRSRATLISTLHRIKNRLRAASAGN